MTGRRTGPLVRVALSLAGLLLGGVAVLGLMAATKNQPDPHIAGTASEVRFDVRVGDRPGGEEAGAQGLWAVCGATLGPVDVGPVVADGDAWSVHVEPSVGEHAHRRLHGCIEDLTVPLVRGDLIAVDDAPAHR